jgi:CarD family transcriptional regulator
MLFQIGERVVHPHHGVGKVVKLETREFERGVMRQYYEISIPGGGTVWVPLDLPGSGLRKLTVRSEIARCRKILRSRPSTLSEDWRLRQAALGARIRQGTITAHCEVVRDLYAYGEHKSLYGTIAALFRTAQDVLCQEWAIVEGISLADALQEVDLLLEKSRLTLSPASE